MFVYIRSAAFIIVVTQKLVLQQSKNVTIAPSLYSILLAVQYTTGTIGRYSFHTVHHRVHKLTYSTSTNSTLFYSTSYYSTSIYSTSIYSTSFYSTSYYSTSYYRAQNLRQSIVLKTSFVTRVSQMGLTSFVDIDIFVLKYCFI